MLIKEVIARFQALHGRHARGSLPPEEMPAYSSLREDFYNVLVMAQRLNLQDGHKARQVVRVASAKKVQITLVGAAPISTMTCDIGIAGFGALVGNELPVGTVCDFVLTASGQALRGQARVAACVRHGSGGATHRVSFVLEAMSEGDRAKLENAVLDAALMGLVKPG